MNYVIIGNSAAAIGAVEGIRKIDESGSITIVSDEKYNAYSRPLISYLLAGKVTEDNMRYRDDDFYEKMNVETRLGTKAVSINKDTIELSDGSHLDYDKLLIATGGTPFVPPMDGLDKEGVFTFIKMDDVKAIDAKVKSGKAQNVVIIGAGLIGLKAAEALNLLGMNVVVVELADRVLSAILDKDAGAIVGKAMSGKGITILTENTVDMVMGGDYVDGVTLRDGTMLACDMLIVAIGVRPNVEIARDSDISIDRGILVDDLLMTSVPFIYAAGDCSQGRDILNDEQRVLPIWPNAYIQGETAGRNMAGCETFFDGGFAMNSIGFFKTHMITAGIINPENPDDYEIIKRVDYGEETCRKLIIKDNKLVGYINVGKIDRSGIMTLLIKDSIDVGAFKSRMMEDDFGYMDLPGDYRRQRMQKGLV